MEPKKFALIITYESGKLVMTTDNIDISKALDEYYKRQIELCDGDKSCYMPRIIGLELLPLMYDSKYGRTKKN